MSTADLVISTLLGLAGGALLALLHLRLLWQATQRLGTDGHGLGRLLGGGALRLVLLVTGLAGVGALAPQPAVAMITAMLGFTLLRSIIVRRLRRAGVG